MARTGEEKRGGYAVKNRDYGVEVIRIIATFIVIGTHVKLNWIVGDVVQNLKLVYTCLWADGVSLFFLITGFFLFNGRNYGQILKNVSNLLLSRCFWWLWYRNL